ncbi:MAG TPA: NAD(P)-dependent oxidoreductase [Blastocatellia bacterium]|nr:NAD(P)-dependent oxidoreductase [Blastocatellia bacterium]
MRIGFIGLGIMGRPMALNLLKAGFDLTVYNRTIAKCQPLVAAGAQQAGSPKEAAERSDVTICIVSDTPDVESVLFDTNGVCEGVRNQTVVIDMSTISGSATVAFAERLRELGCEMLDAPVTGGEKGAIDGTLGIMAGGKRDVFDKCLPILEAMGKTIVYTGPNGNGQKTKLVNQIICALNILAMTEGLRFGRVAGLDLETTLKVVASGAAGSWMLSNLAPRILNNDFAPGFLIRLQQKDLRLCREAIQSTGQRFAGTELTHQLFTEALEKGLGEQGTQALINLWDDREPGDSEAASTSRPDGDRAS